MLDRDPNAKPVNIIHALLLQLDRNHHILRAVFERGDLPRARSLIGEMETAQKAIYEHDAIAILSSLAVLKSNQFPP